MFGQNAEDLNVTAGCTQGCTNPRCQVARANKLCTVAPKTYITSALKVLHVIRFCTLFDVYLKLPTQDCCVSFKSVVPTLLVSINTSKNWLILTYLRGVMSQNTYVHPHGCGNSKYRVNPMFAGRQLQ